VGFRELCGLLVLVPASFLCYEICDYDFMSK
jgi:hypothetical protein